MVGNIFLQKLSTFEGNIFLVIVSNLPLPILELSNYDFFAEDQGRILFRGSSNVYR